MTCRFPFFIGPTISANTGKFKPVYRQPAILFKASDRVVQWGVVLPMSSKTYRLSGNRVNSASIIFTIHRSGETQIPAVRRFDLNYSRPLKIPTIDA